MQTIQEMKADHDKEESVKRRQAISRQKEDTREGDMGRNGPSNKERNTINNHHGRLQYIDENYLIIPEYDEEIAKLFKATVAVMTDCQSDDFMGNIPGDEFI
jgi:hypothetical protein